jgi:hypothetical protein
VAFVGAGPATHADVHEHLEGTILFQALPEPLGDDLLPVLGQLPVVVRGRPVPGVGKFKYFRMSGLAG